AHVSLVRCAVRRASAPAATPHGHPGGAPTLPVTFRHRGSARGTVTGAAVQVVPGQQCSQLSFSLGGQGAQRPRGGECILTRGTVDFQQRILDAVGVAQVDLHDCVSSVVCLAMMRCPCWGLSLYQAMSIASWGDDAMTSVSSTGLFQSNAFTSEQR